MVRNFWKMVAGSCVVLGLGGGFFVGSSVESPVIDRIAKIVKIPGYAVGFFADDPRYRFPERPKRCGPYELEYAEETRTPYSNIPKSYGESGLDSQQPTFDSVALALLREKTQTPPEKIDPKLISCVAEGVRGYNKGLPQIGVPLKVPTLVETKRNLSRSTSP